MKYLLIVTIIFLSCTNTSTTSNTTSTTDSVLTSPASTLEELTTDDVGVYDSSQVKKLVGKFSVKKDEFNGTKWYKPKSAPQYNWVNAFYCYFDGSGNHATNLRFKVQYTSDDWLFIKNCQFLIDSATYRLYPDEVKRDNGSGDIWEWFDINVASDNDAKDIVKALYNAKSAKVKFNGTDYYDTRIISQKQLLSIKETIDLYKAMGGTF